MAAGFVCVVAAGLDPATGRGSLSLLMAGIVAGRDGDFVLRRVA